MVLSAYILDQNDRTFLNLIFYLIFGYKIIILPVVLICVIDCSKLKASFYLMISEDSRGMYMQMKASVTCH